MTFRTPLRIVGAAVASSLLAVSMVAANAEVTPEDDTSPYKLASQPAPTITGAELVDTVAAFSAEFAGRVTATPMELFAAQWIEEQAAGFGYDTVINEYAVTGGLPNTGPIRSVTAFKEGTDPVLKDQVILFSAHYDTLPQSVEGAYDNSTGTTMLLGLAESLANVDTRRSIKFAWYNGEEEGVFGSAAHVKAEKAAGTDIAAVLGFDMVGIAWPVAPTAQTNKTCLCMWHGSDDAAMAPILRTVNYDYLKFPVGNPIKGAVNVEGNNNRNSDERSWENAGAVTIRWAGIKTAAGYPAYHMPDDNMATIYKTAGGREYFEAGMLNTLLSAYYTTLALDTIDDLGGHFLD